jgi:hypothetical protein
MNMPYNHEELIKQFHAVVNMAAGEIEAWLETEESRKVGVKHNGGESVGHASGRRIVEILRTNKADLDGGDYVHMRRVVGFVRRHLAQGPHEAHRIPGSRWRYSLMNWGHDPLRD